MAYPFRRYPRFSLGALGDMWYRATNGDQTPVAGSKTEGNVPVIQADGTVAWGASASTAGLTDQAIAASLAVEAEARLRIDGISATTTTDTTIIDRAIAAARQAFSDAQLADAGITTTSTTDTTLIDRAIAAALQALADARLYDQTVTATVDDLQVALTAQFYGA